APDDRVLEGPDGELPLFEDDLEIRHGQGTSTTELRGWSVMLGPLTEPPPSRSLSAPAGKPLTCCAESLRLTATYTVSVSLVILYAQVSSLTLSVVRVPYQSALCAFLAAPSFFIRSSRKLCPWL